MPRLFTGLEIPEDVAFELDLMKGGVLGARWVERDNYHITLRFIGDIDEGLARDIAEELDTVSAEPFTLRLQGINAFGGTKPHALYVAVAESPELRRLQATHERICQQLGLKAENRKFAPHVTLARLKDARLDNVHRFIAAHNLYASRLFTVGRFVLFSSRPSRGGGPYAVEEAYALGAAL
ncbi:MAG: RNA 2',3'-cyclic phosphodiesterase [Hyphomicrobiales bacterium]